MTSRMLQFVVEGPPQGKARPRFVRTRTGMRTYTLDKTKSYEAQIGFVARGALAGAPMLAGALEVAVSAHYPIPASWSKRKRAQALRNEIRPTVKPDLDNVVKAVLDALNGVAYVDDCQVVDSHGRKSYSERPSLLVQVFELKHLKQQESAHA